MLLAIFIALNSDSGVDRLFATSSPEAPPATTVIAGTLAEADRQEAINVMRSRLGLSSEQASHLVDQALLVAGRDVGVSPSGLSAPEVAAAATLTTAPAVTGWLSGAILLSLLAAIGGGLLGARGTRRPARPAAER